jgi:hypothetical protein
MIRTGGLYFDSEGKYEKSQWRLFSYKGGDAPYREYGEESGSFDIQEGRSYWLIMQSKKTIDVGTGKTAPVDQNFRIPLSAGWTDMGIPFNFSGEGDTGVYVGDILDSSQLSAETYYFYTYDMNGGYIPLFDPLTQSHYRDSVLCPWRGYTVYSSKEGNVVNLPPISRKYSHTSLTPGSKRLSKGSWLLEVSTRSGKAGDLYNGIGSRPGMKGLSSYIPEPTSLHPEVSLYTYHQVSAQESVAVSYSFRDTLGEGWMWSIGLRNYAGENRDMEVRFNLRGELPDGYGEVAVDPAVQGVVDLSKDSVLTVKMRGVEGDEGSVEHELKVIVGTPSYVAQCLRELKFPVEFCLRPGYPNPFNPVTTIRFEVPYMSPLPEVDLRIYDCSGRLVKVLYKGETRAGYYRVMWTGRDHADRPVSSGIYFVQMTAHSAHLSFRNTSKLNLLK